MKPVGIFDRVRLLESRLDRMEVILLEQDRIIQAQARILGCEKPAPYAEPETRSIVKIVAEIAADNGLTMAEIKSTSKTRAICWPRQYAWMLLMDAGFSSASIGRFFRKDHATVLYGVEQARARMAKTPELPQGS